MIGVDREINDIAEIIGEGVHSALRKQCESSESGIAWKAISNMPDGEWNGVCQTVAEVLYDMICKWYGV